MPLTIICMTGAGNTGKTSAIREFTSKYLGYSRPRGDVLGIFQMPHKRYAVGVSGSGDALQFIVKGRDFMERYAGLRVMIVASRSGGKTRRAVEKIAQEKGGKLYLLWTHKISGTLERSKAIRANVAKIRRLLPKN